MTSTRRPHDSVDPKTRTLPVYVMTSNQDRKRRDFLRMTLTTAGAIAIAGPWGLRAARATAAGRAVITFQVPPSGISYFVDLLSAIRANYQPDLGVQPVAMPGLAGGVAMETVAKSPPDGSTVLLAPSTMLSLAPLVWKKPVDPSDSLVPVAGLGQFALGFIVGPAVPAEVMTMSDYILWVRANPRSNSYGVPGLGTATHYVGAEISRLADAPLRVVGYKGVLGLMEDVATGSIPAVVAPVIGPGDLARLPQLRVLAVTGAQRLPSRADVPTLREAGLPDDIPYESLGVFMPIGTPDPKIQELAAAVRAATQTRAVMEGMKASGLFPMTDPNGSYASTLAEERATWQKLVARHDFAAGR